MIEYIDEESEKALHILKNYFRILTISYEEDIEDDPKIAYQKACSFLNLSKFDDVKVKRKRINTMKNKDLITNFNEIEDLLSGTKYEWMLT
ncbi:MAG: hypothetical protein ACFB4I_15030 [Cyanophyceae cyanobacterium]